MLRLINHSLTKAGETNMCNDWMIDVLKDMRQVALQNAMLDFAEHLDDAIIVAAVELGERKVNATVEEYDREDRQSIRPLARYGDSEPAPIPC